MCSIAPTRLVARYPDEEFPRGIHAEFLRHHQRFFSDRALRCCLDALGSDRVMFSVDWPYASTSGCPMDQEHAARSETRRRLCLKTQSACCGSRILPGRKGTDISKMIVDKDVPITVNDGHVLRANVYRPAAAGPIRPHGHGHYGKDVHFEDAYRPQWDKLLTLNPDIARNGSSGRYLR